MEKVSNQNKSNDDSTVNNPVAANESSNVIHPVAGITVTTNAAISTDAGTEELEKVSNKNKSNDDSTVNNLVAANEITNVIRPVAGITVTTNAAISTDAGTEKLEKVSNKNKCKDDSTVTNPVVANESSNVICSAADITVTTNAARSTDAATTASATMVTMVAAPTTADAATLQSKFCATGAVCTHSQGPADLSRSILCCWGCGLRVHSSLSCGNSLVNILKDYPSLIGCPLPNKNIISADSENGMHCICHTCIQTVVDVCYNCNNESITDAIASTANNDNGEKVDGKYGNGINDQRQISDVENGRETFNNNKIESNYE